MPRHLPIDTDLLLGPTAIRRLIAVQDFTRNEHGCMIYSTKSLLVRTTQGPRYVNITRLVWALAHPTEKLFPTELAVHQPFCPFCWCHDSHQVCANPEHLTKGTTLDVVAHRRIRKGVTLDNERH